MLCFRRPFFQEKVRHLMFAACAALVAAAPRLLAGDLPIEAIQLPALRVNGKPARAHTQGLEITSGKLYVTARRDDVLPKRALLLRTDPLGTDWEVWDITPAGARGALTALDHPGGMQSDGDRLWIPLAESQRKGRSLIRVFPIAGIVPGRRLEAAFEFPVSDHIGALAVSAESRIVFGANWDTELVLFASGLFRGPGAAPELPQSRLFHFGGFSEPEFRMGSIVLPKQNGIELAREGMAISDGRVYFLPEDLGASNRVFRVRLADLHSAALGP